MDDSELDAELLQVAGQGGRKRGSQAKRKRSRRVASDNSDDEVSLDEESDWDAEEEVGRCVVCVLFDVAISLESTSSR
jgi:hypothetical protein